MIKRVLKRAALTALALCCSQAIAAATIPTLNDVRAAMSASDWLKAEQELNQVVDAAPKNALAHYLRAQVKDHQHDRNGMCDDLKLAVSLEPSQKFATNPATLKQLTNQCNQPAAQQMRKQLASGVIEGMQQASKITLNQHNNQEPTVSSMDGAMQDTMANMDTVVDTLFSGGIFKLALVLLIPMILFPVIINVIKSGVGASVSGETSGEYKARKLKEFRERLERYQQLLTTWLDGHSKRVLDARLDALSNEQSKLVDRLNAAHADGLKYQQRITEYLALLKKEKLPNESDIRALCELIDVITQNATMNRIDAPRDNQSAAWTEPKAANREATPTERPVTPERPMPFAQARMQPASPTPIIVQQETSVLDEVLKVAAIESLLHSHHNVEREVIIEREPVDSGYRSDDSDSSRFSLDLGDSSSDWSGSDNSSSYDSGDSSSSWSD